MGRKAKRNQEEEEEEEFDSEEEIKTQKKTKKVEKKQKDGNKEKKVRERNSSGAPKGRPKQSKNPISVKDDPTATIQQRILQYLDKIGLKHGLVFRRQEREKMREEKLGIEWNEDHEWDCKKQKSKIQSDPKITNTIQEYIQKILSQSSENDIKWLIEESLINIGDIAAEQCTKEIYYMIVEAMESKIKGENIQEIALRTKKLLSTLKFMSLKFTNKYEKYWLDFKETSEKKIEEQFTKLFSDISSKVDILYTKKMNDLRQFINEQIWMAEQLQKIRAEAIQRLENN